MITRSTILHLRLQFSWLLLPIYLLALLSAGSVDLAKAGIVFFVLHFLLYPAANGFNSFYDRDEESIGTLARPPPVTPDLLRVSLALDAAAIAVGLVVGPLFALGCLLYGLGSKAYSHPAIHLKRYPWLGWLTTGLGQGSFVFLLVAACVQGPERIPVSDLWLPAAAVALFTMGLFPVTQVYQHREDLRRGCTSISLRLGVRGTFCLSSLFATAGILLYCYRLGAGAGAGRVWMFLLLNAPAAAYLVYWGALAWRDEAKADFRRATTMVAVAATGVNVFALLALFGVSRGWQFLTGV
jgi:4-hydroxybenzoate polyprenyltransferase